MSEENVQKIESAMGQAVNKNVFVLVNGVTVEVGPNGPVNVETEHGQDLDKVLEVVLDVLKRHRKPIQ